MLKLPRSWHCGIAAPMLILLSLQELADSAGTNVRKLARSSERRKGRGSAGLRRVLHSRVCAGTNVASVAKLSKTFSRASRACEACGACICHQPGSKFWGAVLSKAPPHQGPEIGNFRTATSITLRTVPTKMGRWCGWTPPALSTEHK